MLLAMNKSIDRYKKQLDLYEYALKKRIIALLINTIFFPFRV